MHGDGDDGGTGLVLVALDGFKRINEALGVGEGDRILAAVAQRLRGPDLPVDLLARWSGDQFAALMRCPDAAAIALHAQRFHAAIAQLTAEPAHARVSASVGAALDDFGCGHSSLALLRSLRVQQVKIDRSFVADITEDAGAQALVRAIISLAQALGQSIVAEGVETIEQSGWLREHGCHLQQGYLFARPMPLPQLRSYLAARQSDAAPA